MYKLQKKPDKTALLSNNSKITPLVTLKDEYGGISHIIEDDHCLVLVNGSKDRKFEMVSHWYIEAVEELRQLLKSKEYYKIRYV